MSKNISLCLIYIIVSFWDNTEPKQRANNYFINADLPNWNSTYVSISIEGKTIYADSVLNGKFEYKGVIKGVKEGSFVIQKYGLTITLPLYFEAGMIRIKDFEKNTTQFEISGTKNNDEFRYFNNQLDSFFPCIRSLTEQASKDCIRKRKEYALAYIERNKNAIVVLEVFRNNILKSDLADMEKLALFKSLKNQLRETFGGKELLQNINKLINTSIGKMAPSFTLPDTSNKNIILKQFRGKYILLDFWASWCVACRAENPVLKNIFVKYKGNKFNIISISLDSDKEHWLSAISNDQLPWTHLSDLKGWKNVVSQLYYIEEIPANFLLDPHGVIIGKNLKGQDLEKILKSYLGLN